MVMDRRKQDPADRTLLDSTSSIAINVLPPASSSGRNHIVDSSLISLTTCYIMSQPTSLWLRLNLSMTPVQRLLFFRSHCPLLYSRQCWIACIIHLGGLYTASIHVVSLRRTTTYSLTIPFHPGASLMRALFRIYKFSFSIYPLFLFLVLSCFCSGLLD